MSTPETKPESSPTPSKESPTKSESPTNIEKSQTNIQAQDSTLLELRDLLKEQVGESLYSTLGIENKPILEQIQTLKMAKLVSKVINSTTPKPDQTQKKIEVKETNGLPSTTAETYSEPKKLHEINRYETFISQLQESARANHKKLGGF